MVCISISYYYILQFKMSDETEVPLNIFVVTFDVSWMEGLYVATESHKILSWFSLRHLIFWDCMMKFISCSFSCISQSKVEITVPQFCLFCLWA